MNDFHNIHRTSYNLIAAEYARKNAAQVPEVMASAEYFIQFLDHSSTILDIGCGHGRETAWFVSQGLRTLAFDLSKGMLQQTRHLVQVPLIEGNMLSLPFRRHTFNAIWCNAAFLHIPKSKARQGLMGFYSILVNNGLLYLALQAGTGEVWEQQSYGTAAPRFFSRYTLDEAAFLVESAGYAVLSKIETKKGPRSHWLHLISRKSE